MSRILDRVSPPRLGTAFRWLLSSTWVGNLGEGIALAAGPLLVASQTRNAMLVALAALLQRLPWLLFGLYAGAVADRVDRKRLIVAADAARLLVVAVLCLSIAIGWVNITVVLAAMFLLGIAEVFSDTTSSTLPPMLVPTADLGLSNSRLMGGYLVANQIVGPPIGAFLFAVGMAWPFFVQVVTGALALLLIARMALPGGAVRDASDTHIRRDIAEGIRWLLHHAAVRTLALVILAFNITWGAAWSVLVLYSLDHLHMGAVGFGLLTSAAAVGGLASVLSFARIEAAFSMATLMRVCLLLEVVTHLSLALTTRGWVAMLIMVVFGAYAFVWATVSQTVRQRVVPTELQGRVASVYMLGLFGGLVIGQAIGGWIAETWGLTAPFWFAFVGSGITLALVWRELAHIAAAPPEPYTAPAA